MGATAAAAGGTGAGYFALTGTGAAATVNIQATNPGQVSNDRGDLTKVTIDPTFRVEWENMDTAVAKVFYVIEGRTREDGTWNDWSPLFRSTPWLSPGSGQGVSKSKPGTTGHLEFSDPLSAILNRSSGARGDKDQDPRALPRPLEVVNELGRPDYEGTSAFDDHPVSSDTYLAGNSVGGADEATIHLDNWVLSRTAGDPIETGSSSLAGSPEGDADLPLVNHFPGAESGYYGAAMDTSQMDVGEDSSSDTDSVQIRYTFALQTLNGGSVEFFTANSFGSYAGVDDAVQNDPHLENVRPSDVQQDSGGNSILVMDGEDGYPSVTDHPDVSSPAENHYDGLQSIADAHPAVVSTTASFDVTVVNEQADAGATGDTNSGVEGGGQ